ncbi:MAG: hypothetical protein PHU51_05465 [Candidatus Nanoarchaeia archaeon]|jgi:hypothetical protein|nr:hypothetical protein [Candidatus Nanoarchaeia archaeon]
MDLFNTKQKRLERENKALIETCEVLSNQAIMKDIKKSLKQIYNGKFSPLSKL